VTASSTRVRDLVALILAAACWGLGTVISKAALEELSPIALLAAQLAASVAVLAIVQPDKLVLCADRFTLSDERDKVRAVAAALERGYTQAQLEPDEAAQVMGIDATQVEDAAPSWTAGAKRFGELKPGPGRDPLY